MISKPQTTPRIDHLDVSNDKKHAALAAVYAEWLVCHSKLVNNDDISDEEGTAICDRLT